jgi:glyoxylase-like metal-dependent hydrolase (beta-lactamase superfamily II)
LHTPGHAPNHLCFWLEEERVLFTGDHVLNGTTTVVNPDRGGDMRQYLASLDRLRKLKRVARICPGHGDVVEDASALLDEYVKHRKARERQILKLVASEPQTIAKLVDTIYVDTPHGLVEMAQKQVHAHLLKLRADGKVAGTNARAKWSATGTARR